MNQAKCKICGEIILVLKKEQFAVFAIAHVLQKHFEHEKVKKASKLLAECAKDLFEMELEE